MPMPVGAKASGCLFTAANGEDHADDRRPRVVAGVR